MSTLVTYLEFAIAARLKRRRQSIASLHHRALRRRGLKSLWNLHRLAAVRKKIAEVESQVDRNEIRTTHSETVVFPRSRAAAAFDLEAREARVRSKRLARAKAHRDASGKVFTEGGFGILELTTTGVAYVAEEDIRGLQPGVLVKVQTWSKISGLSLGVWEGKLVRKGQFPLGIPRALLERIREREEKKRHERNEAFILRALLYLPGRELIRVLKEAYPYVDRADAEPGELRRRTKRFPPARIPIALYVKALQVDCEIPFSTEKEIRRVWEKEQALWPKPETQRKVRTLWEDRHARCRVVKLLTGPFCRDHRSRPKEMSSFDSE